MVSTFPTRSKTSPPFIKIPIFAPWPVPTMMAVGVAKPNAQGQAMINTEIKIIRAKEKEEVEISATELPNIHQKTKEMAARQITDGTKTPAILSASV